MNCLQHATLHKKVFHHTHIFYFYFCLDLMSSFRSLMTRQIEHVYDLINKLFWNVVPRNFAKHPFQIGNITYNTHVWIG